MKLHMHIHTMVMYIRYQFHEIPSIDDLVTAEDGKKSLRGGGFPCPTTMHMGLATAKPVFGVSDKARLKTACSATETS